MYITLLPALPADAAVRNIRILVLSFRIIGSREAVRAAITAIIDRVMRAAVAFSQSVNQK